MAVANLSQREGAGNFPGIAHFRQGCQFILRPSPQVQAPTGAVAMFQRRALAIGQQAAQPGWSRCQADNRVSRGSLSRFSRYETTFTAPPLPYYLVRRGYIGATPSFLTGICTSKSIGRGKEEDNTIKQTN